MSYYPNTFYTGNTNGQYMPYQTPQQTPQQFPQMQNQMSALNGKFVDGIEMVRATEVPIGGYGIFPKADLSEIYIKAWNNNGTTNVVAFKPVPTTTPQANQITPDVSTVLTTILSKLEHLEAELTTTPVKGGE